MNRRKWFAFLTLVLMLVLVLAGPLALAPPAVAGAAAASPAARPQEPLLTHPTAAGPALAARSALTGTQVFLPIISHNYVPLQAAFDVTPAAASSVGTPVVFASTSSGTGPLSLTWDFGDGAVDVGTAAPAHVYTRTGTFNVTLTASNAMETRTAQRAIEVVAAAGTELIANGGFESTTAWEFPTTPIPAAYVSGVARSGTRSARMGITPALPNLYSYSSVLQRVVLPAGAARLTLSYWYWPQRDGTTLASEPNTLSPDIIGTPLAALQSSCPQDTQYAMLLDANKNVLAPLMAVTENGAGWTYRSYDLSGFRGRTIYVYFDVCNDGAGARTWMHVDDVSLTADVPPTASFIRSPFGVVPPGASVVFTSTSTGTAPLTYAWNFGDGSPVVTTTNATHVYTRSGTFNVTLTVANPFGSNTATQQIVVANTTGTELIVNGGFESNTAWEFPLTAFPAGYSTAAAHSGTRSARLGIVPPSPDIYSYSSVLQRVTVPANAVQTILSFWYWPQREGTAPTMTSVEASADQASPAAPRAGMSLADWQSTCPQDTQFALLLDTNQNILAPLMALTENRTGWTYRSYDLSGFRGYTFYVYFDVCNNGSSSEAKRAWMYVDDVSLVASVSTDVPPVASFTRSPAGTVPVSTTVYFTSTSTGTAPLTYTWNFGDGSPAATGATATHVYTRAGTFNVTLTVANPFGSSVATQQVFAISATGTELIVNGGFESTAAWEFPTTPIPAAYVSGVAHSGTRSARMGITPALPNLYSYSSVLQRVTIPANASQVVLSYWYWPQRDGTALASEPDEPRDNLVGVSLLELQSTCPVDTQYALVLDQNKVILQRLMAVSENLGTWATRSYDLTAYRGRTIYVYFDVCNNGSSPRTWMHLDDVSLIAQVPTGVPPTASFIRSPTGTVPVSATVYFTSTSTGSAPLTYAWNFGDGSPVVTTANATHVYTRTGTFNVTLTVANPYGSNATTQSVVVGGTTAELIVNGGFESDSAWEFPLTAFPASYTTVAAHSGTRSARLGIVPPSTNVYSYSSVKQRIAIPSTAGQTILSFWYWPQREGGSLADPPAGTPTDPVGMSLAQLQSTCPVDTQYALLLDQNGTVIANLMSITEHYTAWTYRSYDLSGFRGWTLYVYFDVCNDGAGARTWMYVDDVSVAVTP